MAVCLLATGVFPWNTESLVQAPFADRTPNLPCQRYG